MASRPDKEALALSALGEFAKSFIAAKQQRRAESRDDERFARELAAKRLEDEQARRYQQFKAEMDAQQALLGVTRAGAKKALYDASGKLTGYEESGIDPATVSAGQQEVEAIIGRYRGVSNAPSIMPGIEGTPVAVDKGISRPSVFPGLDVPQTEAKLEVNPAPLPKEATTPLTGLRPASSVKTTTTGKGGDGSGTGDDKSMFWDTMDKEFAQTAQKWETTGRAEFASGTASLEQTANDFLSGKVKGGWLGLLPGRSLTRPELDQAVKQVEKVVFPQLRMTMGAQFTEKEGKRVIDATIDPTQNGENNARRLLALLEVMKEQAGSTENMIKYAKQKGSLRGYPNPSLGLDSESIKRRIDEKIGGGASPITGETPEQRKARLLEEIKGAR